MIIIMHSVLKIVKKKHQQKCKKIDRLKLKEKEKKL